LTVKPGRYCLIFQYLDSQDYNQASWSNTQQFWKATVDSEVDMFWPRAFLLPICVLMLPLLISSIIGAQKAGRAFKELRFPESSSKSTEEQVMDAAEAEKAMGMYLSTGSERVDEQKLDSDQTPSQDDTIDSQNEGIDSDENSEKTSTESENGASQYTDEQLLAAGWTHEQIAQMRGN
ncbi:MAG: hypothetical protein VX854_06600, partial [Candidatus Thermoplasmatota archaeon]|nr:hypothetical protein [Candidatus Thermoplasmatota archaeon]